jgi:hypothetical protein
MPSDLPPILQSLCDEQSGVVTRSQILEAGLTKDIIYSRISRGSWQQLYAGIYAAFSGEPNRLAVLWAAVLSAGPGAMLSHRTAAELWGILDEPSPLIHITIPSARRLARKQGIVFHLSGRASAAVHPSRNPPRTRLEETVIDLWDAAQSLDHAVAWVTSALGRRLTTQDKLRGAMQARGRVRRRQQLAELLSTEAAGIHSVLEYRYVHNVERPHGLSGAKRQVRVRRNGRNEYRDQLYEEYGVAVELDGRAAHPGDTRWKDIRRDNAAAALGISTLRYGWFEVTVTPCIAAAELADVVTARGYVGARPCSPVCPVAHTSAARTPAAQVSAARTPAAQVSAAQMSAARTPAARVSAARVSVARTPAARTSAATQTASLGKPSQEAAATCRVPQRTARRATQRRPRPAARA